MIVRPPTDASLSVCATSSACVSSSPVPAGRRSARVTASTIGRRRHRPRPAPRRPGVRSGRERRAAGARRRHPRGHHGQRERRPGQPRCPGLPTQGPDPRARRARQDPQVERLAQVEAGRVPAGEPHRGAQPARWSSPASMARTGTCPPMTTMACARTSRSASDEPRSGRRPAPRERADDGESNAAISRSRLHRRRIRTKAIFFRHRPLVVSSRAARFQFQPAIILGTPSSDLRNVEQAKRHGRSRTRTLR